VAAGIERRIDIRPSTAIGKPDHRSRDHVSRIARVDSEKAFDVRPVGMRYRDLLGLHDPYRRASLAENSTGRDARAQHRNDDAHSHIRWIIS